MAIDLRFTDVVGGFRLGLFEGEVEVANLIVGRYTMRLAGGEVQMGGIAGVVTHPVHRGRGLGVQMLRATVARMREERYPISVLWGISDFYHRFGYTPVLAGYTLTVSTRNAERLVDSDGSAGSGSSGGAGEVKVRPGTAADAPALLELTCPAQGDEPEQRATLRLDPDGAPATGRTAHLRLPQQRLCQLLMGYQGIDALRREHAAACTEEDVPFIRSVFPEGNPHMWSIDHF